MNTPNVVVTERDQRIFQFLFEHKIASCDQIGRIFFKGAKKPTYFQRLLKLHRVGFLNWDWVRFWGNRIPVVSLTDKGFSEFRHNYTNRVVQKRAVSDSPTHDLGLVEVRQRFLESDLVESFTSENMLQACPDLQNESVYETAFKIHSDGVIKINSPHGIYRLVVEYEISDKAAKRYDSKLLEYYLSPSIVGVLYICGNKMIQNLICQSDHRMAAKFDPKVFTCQEEKFHNASSKLAFTNRESAIFELPIAS